MIHMSGQMSFTLPLLFTLQFLSFFSAFAQECREWAVRTLREQTLCTSEYLVYQLRDAEVLLLPSCPVCQGLVFQTGLCLYGTFRAASSSCEPLKASQQKQFRQGSWSSWDTCRHNCSLMLAAVAITANKAAVFVWITYQSARWGGESLSCFWHCVIHLLPHSTVTQWWRARKGNPHPPLLALALFNATVLLS